MQNVSEVADPLFKIEDRGNGYRFLTAPDFPGFSAMLKPGELFWSGDHARTLIMLAVLDERERCARVAECNMPRNEPGEYAKGRFAAADAIRGGI